MDGTGCSKCSGHLLDLDYFIQKSKELHGSSYDYSKVNFINSKIKVEIICPEHGSFQQRPNDHLNGNRCPKCAGRYMDTDFFIQKAQNIHGLKFNYDKVIYIYIYKSNNIKVNILYVINMASLW